MQQDLQKITSDILGIKADIMVMKKGCNGLNEHDEWAEPGSAPAPPEMTTLKMQTPEEVKSNNMDIETIRAELAEFKDRITKLETQDASEADDGDMKDDTEDKSPFDFEAMETLMKENTEHLVEQLAETFGNRMVSLTDRVVKIERSLDAHPQDSKPDETRMTLHAVTYRLNQVTSRMSESEKGVKALMKRVDPELIATHSLFAMVDSGDEEDEDEDNEMEGT